MTTRITIRKPDDWHLHVRDGEMLKAVLPYTAQHFGRAILMPNLVPPIRTTQEAIAYRERVMAALPQGSRFHAADDLLSHRRDRPRRRRARLSRRRVHRRQALSGQRHHQLGGRRDRLPQHHARAGAHGKDRHAVSHARRGGRPRYRHFRPRGGVHRSASVEMGEGISRAAHDHGAPVVEAGRRLRQERGAAGRRHHHALSSQPDPHRLARRRHQADDVRHAGDQDRRRPRRLAQGRDVGRACYFLGTDSAPHPFARKVAISGVPGIFNAPVALATYAKVFEEEGALDKLEAFASLNGPRHYRLPPNEDKIVLEKTPWTAPVEVKVAGPDERTLLYRGGETIEWQVVAS